MATLWSVNHKEKGPKLLTCCDQVLKYEPQIDYVLALQRIQALFFHPTAKKHSSGKAAISSQNTLNMVGGCHL